MVVVLVVVVVVVVKASGWRAAGLGPTPTFSIDLFLVESYQ